MTPPTNKRLEIIKYRDFFDIPRYMLVSDSESQLWILECAFDDDLDEYPAEFYVFPAGADLAFAQETFELHAKYSANIGTPMLKVKVESIEFDSTKQKECFIRNVEAEI
jgi:hypothetical protein